MNAPTNFGPVQLSTAGATALVRTAPAPNAIMRPTTVAELDIFAQRAARSGMVPAQYAGKPDAIFIAVQMGSELGLSPMQALSNIAVVNGRPSVWGDAMPGLCRQSSLCDDIEEWFEGDGETLTAFCRATRIGKQPVVQKFGVTDAKKAGLWTKTGPWTQYPRRMLQMRARGFALRDAFPDVLRGLISYEEARDIPVARKQQTPPFSGATLEAEPEEPIDDAIPERVMAAPAPAQKVRPTWGMLLADINAELARATTEEQIELVAGSADASKVLLSGKEAAIKELDAMMSEAMARVRDTPHDPETGEVDEAEFPGDRP